MTVENLFLLVIVVQGFAVWVYEYRVWKIHADRAAERKTWRQAKQKQALKTKEIQIDRPENSTTHET